MSANPRVTVGQLVAALSELDPALGVLVEGYEGGYTSPRIDGPSDFAVSPWQQESALFGEYDEVDETDERSTDDYRAIVLTRDEP